MLYRKDPRPFREDPLKIFNLIENGRIDPMIDATFPLLAAGKALERLERGASAGKIALSV